MWSLLAMAANAAAPCDEPYLIEPVEVDGGAPGTVYLVRRRNETRMIGPVGETGSGVIHPVGRHPVRVRWDEAGPRCEPGLVAGTGPYISGTVTDFPDNAVVRIRGCGVDASLTKPEFTLRAKSGRCTLHYNASDMKHSWKGSHELNIAATELETVVDLPGMSLVGSLGVVLTPHADGLQVVRFRANSAAIGAGINLGEVITRVDGVKLAGLPKPEANALFYGAVGDQRQLTLGQREVVVWLRPDDSTFDQKSLGLRMEPDASDLVVAEVAEPAASAGILPGDRLVGFAMRHSRRIKKDITGWSPADFNGHAAGSGKRILRLERDGKVRRYVLPTQRLSNQPTSTP